MTVSSQKSVASAMWLAMFAALSGAAGAQPAAIPSAGHLSIRIADGQPRSLDDLATGEQIVLEGKSGPINFAGRQLALVECSAIVGYASEIAYVAVLEGNAALGNDRAARGDILMIPPYGGKVSVAKFDAARLRRAWPSATASAAPVASAALDKLARGQKISRFFGRYQPTGFNVAASGAPRAEAARRTLVGGTAVRAIRFGGTDPATIEQTVVDRFIRALREGDASAAAELLDPLAFGGADMGQGGSGARLVYARSLLARRDWGSVLGAAAAVRGPETNLWRLSGASGTTVIALRATPDFAFIRSISTGENQ